MVVYVIFTLKPVDITKKKTECKLFIQQDKTYFCVYRMRIFNSMVVIFLHMLEWVTFNETHQLILKPFKTYQF